MKKTYMTPLATEEKLLNGFPVLFGEGDSEDKDFGDGGDDTGDGFDAKERDGIWGDDGKLWP